MEKIEEQIDGLARAVANGFDAIEKRFDEQQAHMDTRFDAIDRQFEDVGQQLRDIRSEVGELKDIAISLDEQTELRARLVRIEDHLGLPHELSKEPAA